MRERPNKSKKGDVTDITVIQRIARDYSEQIWQPTRNGKIPRSIQPTKTEAQRNRKVWTNKLLVGRQNQ